jgi:hypothetical protein
MSFIKYLLIIPVFCSLGLSGALGQVKQDIPPDEVQIYTNEEILPPNISKIGSLKIGYPTIFLFFYTIDHQYKSYYEVLKELQIRASKMGGNMVVLKKYQGNILGRSEYHYVRGEVFLIDEPLNKIQKKLDEEVLLHIYSYREYIPRKGMYVNDSLVLMLRGNLKRTIRLKKTKLLYLDFENEERLQIKLDSFPEYEYYIRCMGRMKSNYKPFFQLMPFERGRLEFESYIVKNNN